MSGPRQNTYRPWEQYGETELKYYRRVYLEEVHESTRLLNLLETQKAEIARLAAEVKRLRSVVEDAYWEGAGDFRGEDDRFLSDGEIKAEWMISDARRALDGKP